MADKVSKFIFPVKSGNTIANKEFDLPSGESVTVDDTLSNTSENPVQNKVVKQAIDNKSDTGHNHDDRYYTETEVNNIVDTLNGNDVQKIERNGITFTVTRNDGTTFTFSQQDSDTKYSNGTGLNLSGTTFSVKYGTAAGTACQGNDSRLSDSRNAKDVYSWAKAASKPTYTASEVGAIATSAKGTANGVAELDSSGKVPSSQLPSYVDDVLEYDSQSNFPSTGETGKIYIAKDTNKSYRWTGSAYSQIKGDLALGETSSTAYRGDRGKTAYDHSQSTHARTDATKTEASSTNGYVKINGTDTKVYEHPSGTNPHGTTKSDVGLGNVGNFKAVSTVASQGLSDTEKSNARANIGAGTSSFSGSYNDLADKPTIPTVNNATLTIQKNGTTVKTFTANASSNVTANITVPTKTSELTNDSSFTSNTGTVTKVSTGVGLTGGDVTTTGTIKANLRSETKLTNASTAATETADRVYPVALDKDGKLAVNVPWTDNNTDTKVSQTATSTSANYEVLFSNSANNTTETAGARKDSGLTFNPNTDTLTTKYINNKVIKALTGSGTAGSDAGSGVSPRYTPSKWTINADVTVANGEVYFVKIPVAGGTYGVWLSLNNGTNYYPVAVSSNNGRFTTQYPKDTVIAVTYESASACTCYALAGADSTADVTGCFRVLNDYDSGNTNNLVAQTNTTTNADYRVLFSNNANDTTETKGARKNTNLKYNPSTGNLQTTKLNGVDVGSSPKFTDTTYSSKSAASGGTDISLVTTGEKYTWNSKANSSHNHDDRYYTEAEENQIIEALQSTIVDSIYPVGSLYMSINNTMPSFLTQGRTWELLSGNYVLKTISSGTGGQTSNAGNTGSTTLTAAQSGVPAHSHGLNSHTHNIPALSGSAASNGVHSHALGIKEQNSGLFFEAEVLGYEIGTSYANNDWYVNTLHLANSSSNIRALDNGWHTHSVTTNASTTGAASGSTANNGAANASQGHTHTAGMPQNIGVYVWKRTA